MITAYRYQSAAEVRKALTLWWGDCLPCRVSVEQVSFSWHAVSAVIITLNWAMRESKRQPVFSLEFKNCVYQMFAERFPKGSGVIIKSRTSS